MTTNIIRSISLHSVNGFIKVARPEIVKYI